MQDAVPRRLRVALRPLVARPRALQKGARALKDATDGTRVARAPQTHVAESQLPEIAVARARLRLQDGLDRVGAKGCFGELHARDPRRRRDANHVRRRGAKGFHLQRKKVVHDDNRWTGSAGGPQKVDHVRGVLAREGLGVVEQEEAGALHRLRGRNLLQVGAELRRRRRLRHVHGVNLQREGLCTLHHTMRFPNPAASVQHHRRRLSAPGAKLLVHNLVERGPRRVLP